MKMKNATVPAMWLVLLVAPAPTLAAPLALGGARQSAQPVPPGCAFQSASQTNADRSWLPSEQNPGANWVQTWWEPCDVCSHRSRIGPTGEGGKWICLDSLPKPSPGGGPAFHVISIGSDNDFRWEKAMVAQFGCTIDVYDPTSRPPPKPIPGLRFFKEPGSLDAALAPARVPPDTVIEIFKIDCEGCEIPLFREQLARHADRLRQIQVELHWNQYLGAEHRSWRTWSKRYTHSAVAQVSAAKTLSHLWKLFVDNRFFPFEKEPNIMYTGGGCYELSLRRVLSPS